LEFISRFTPKSISALRDYSWRIFSADLVAGITVGLVALPLAMAFAIASGVPPQAGLYTAVVAGFIISALGGSKTQIGGPTGAFVVIIFGIVTRYGLAGLVLCTVMAGVVLVLMGLTGLGAAISFIPRPVVLGFSNGIAVLIASTQIKDFFGLTIDKVPGDFVGRMRVVIQQFHTLSRQETAFAVGTLVIILFFLRYVRRVPGSIVALVAGTAAVMALRLPVATIGTRFGGIPTGLPHLVLPHFSWALVSPLLAPTMTIAMLGAIESLFSAVVADRMSNDTHNPNMELVAQGIANIASPLFGGLPATGAIARTATNIRSGAQSPMAGIIHALTLVGILLFAAPLAKFVPLAVLAAILMVVCYNMGEWHAIPEIVRLGSSDILVWLLTFTLTVFADLTVAVEFGMILAALIFIRRVTATTTVSMVTPAYVTESTVHSLQGRIIPPFVRVFRIHGPFLFGATGKIDEIGRQVATLPPIVILRLRNMTALDATGLRALEDFAEQLRVARRTLIVCGIRDQPSALMRAAEFDHRVGRDNFCPNIASALQRAMEIGSRTADDPDLRAGQRTASV